MKKQALARLFYREIEKLLGATSADYEERLEGASRLLNTLFLEATRWEQLQFTTLFARIAYTCQQYQVPKDLRFRLHYFRKQVRQSPSNQSEKLFHLGVQVLAELTEVLFGESTPQELLDQLPEVDQLDLRPVEIKGFHARIRAVVLADDESHQQLIAYDEAQPAVEVRVQYNIPDRNENFNPTIEAIRQWFRFPVTVNLLDVEIDETGLYRPAAFVVEPDFLVDVSAISECFQSFGAESRLYLLKKFIPFVYSKPLMIGNIANFFLDELMTNPEATFKTIFPQVFRLNPLAFVLFSNQEVRDIMQSSQKHYVNLKQMVANGFAQNDINPKSCFLEPSFYSERYGIQGRLDVFYKNEEQSAIVELKSGKPFRPNVYGLSTNHYTQTLLYDLIVRSVYGEPLDPKNYILYSGVEDRQLRFAPRVRAQQYEALQLRNQILALEKQLQQLSEEEEGLDCLAQLTTAAIPMARGFISSDLMAFEKVYRGQSPVERLYFRAFTAFIAREQQLAKTGVEGLDNVNGLAALWRAEKAEKEQSFEIISHLRIKQHHAQASDPIIIFEKTAQTNPLANFRAGDIAVLYPNIKEGDTVLQNQIFKCTIIAITKTEVLIRLRSRQFNDVLFRQEYVWNLEHDMLDSSFTAMYRSLYQFFTFPTERRQLLLAQRPPRQPAFEENITAPRELTEEQRYIFAKMLNAPEYFLLWGPPGTGKTSMMLKHLVSYLLNESDENLLLLAYTNRAVDEICHAIESIDKLARREYLRIGSRYSTQERFHDRLLDHQVSQIGSRAELKEVLLKHRIIVATVASLSSKQELLRLKSFDRVIIDEASQILEPMLVGMLPHFPRFVLIGDHKQLPAVVIQDAQVSAVQSEALHELGLHNLRDSLFERLYRRCRSENWDWAYAQLSHQGRMHADIMTFPNAQFYEDSLRTLPASIPISAKQRQHLTWHPPIHASVLDKLLCEQRMIFLPTPVDSDSRTGKTNLHEAQLIAQLVQSYQDIYAVNGKDFTAESIGVITPYRAQIAQIREEIQKQEIDADLLTIDTVERYQGGAREIILISLCLNQRTQLRSLVSLSTEGVDRKLNVALTRARQQLVILGNPGILQQNEIYSRLIEACAVPVEEGE